MFIAYTLFPLDSTSTTLGFQCINSIAKPSLFAQVKLKAVEYKDESTQEDENYYQGNMIKTIENDSNSDSQHLLVNEKNQGF